MSILVLILVLIFLSRATYNVYTKARESAENLARVNGALAETQARKESLVKQTAKLNTEQGKEDEIRHKFQVAKEGEKVIVVIDDETAEPATTTDESFMERMGKIKDAIMTKISSSDIEEDADKDEHTQPAASVKRVKEKVPARTEEVENDLPSHNLTPHN